ncbi:MAG TPA: peroxiredoxin [Burkholderiales bacterium]|nr:peroxiredoxin [Burkholderiales bacterium]
MTKLSRALSIGVSGLLAAIGLAAQADALAPGMPAPAFELKDQEGKTHRLEDYRDRWVVLYFYPKDDTPGCTAEACNFRDDLPKLRALGVQIIGISVDSSASHAQFAKKFSLPFPLLSDEGGTVATRYGSLWSMGPVKFAKRHTFVIDPQGKLARIYRDVKPDEHSRQVMDDVKQLQHEKS